MSDCKINKYDPKKIEATEQQKWKQRKAFCVKENDDKEKFYCLSMFPYPSGRLHMGHVRNYTIGDVISRSQRMLGKNVMQPMGWDAFGLPAENAAAAHNINPAKWTKQNITEMKVQLEALGFSYDWDRELATCTPEYYKWEQWFFTRLFEKGLIVRRKSVVNWDPVDNTVLANEQVIDGRGWRSKALVEKREIETWFIKITDYAEELLTDLEKLPNWPEKVKAMQKNWIGRSQGVEVSFDVLGEDVTLDVYTTRPDTLYGVSYVAISAQHPLAQQFAKDNPSLQAFIKECKHGGVSEAELEKMEKRGVDTGRHAVHPVTGETVPIWIANFVLMEYGSGAVMAVPAHDQRDWDFAKKYDLPILQVIEPTDTEEVNIEQKAFVGKGRCIESGMLTGMRFDEAFEAICSWLESTGKGKRSVKYRLRDWGVSRQRYWGAPIPMACTQDGMFIPVPEDKLPVILPEDVEFTGGLSPIKADLQWSQSEINGEAVTLETDTFDTFVESAWYYARFCSPSSADALIDEAAARYWLPVDQYIGGEEHAVMHLLYARFFHKLLRDDGLVFCDEPFERLLCQGMVLAESFYRESSDGQRQWFHPSTVNVEYNDKGKAVRATSKVDGEPVESGGVTKMSKSQNNGIDPQALIDQYGADTVRVYTMFASPPENTLEWVDSAVEGVYRFMKRVHRIVTEHYRSVDKTQCDITGQRPGGMSGPQTALWDLTQQTIARVTHDVYDRQHFNTAIARLMELTNCIQKTQETKEGRDRVIAFAIESLVKMLHPFAPHLCQHLWSIAHDTLLDFESWPTPSEPDPQQGLTKIAVQVDGRLRGALMLDSTDMSESYLVSQALDLPNVGRFVALSDIKRTIYVPNKVVNLVTA